VLVTTDRSWAYILATLFLFHQMAKLTPDGTVLHRLVLLLLALAGVASSVWLVRKMRPGRSDIPPGWLRATKLGARSAGVLFTVGLIANIVGSVGLSMIVVTGTLRAVLAAVVLLVVVVLLRALVRVVMLLQPVRRLGIVSQRGDITRRNVYRAITILAVVVWVAVTLRGFKVLDPVLESLRALVNVELSLGSFTLTPGDVLIFALVIWVSFKLARVISFALDADVLPHMHLPRGVPGAVTRLTRYAVIVVGVLVAFSAAGFAVDRITIIFGALGVGIGFGLQNVVSNFVSGLILLFERPIQVGDRVQLATVEGVVMDIGMRASTIRSYSGADIVVPNANLISAEVVNWTLRDRTRRMEIRVGVAYGTDPATVLDILVDVATKHPHVDDNPKPEAVFVDFGESSLDFQLRAWTAAARYFNVSSELRVAITQALKEAEIQIPFPQRDLHLRSADDGVSFKVRRDEHGVD
jgi:small-conductance mechanosensitive channel